MSAKSRPIGIYIEPEPMFTLAQVEAHVEKLANAVGDFSCRCSGDSHDEHCSILKIADFIRTTPIGEVEE